MRKIASYSIANTNVASGSISVRQYVDLNCPRDATGNTPVALLFQSTDWLKVFIFSKGEQASLFHLKGQMAVVCPNNITKISLENQLAAATLSYYLTPLDSAPDNNACYSIFNSNVVVSDLTVSPSKIFDVPLNSAGNRPEYLMFQAKGNVKYTFDLDPFGLAPNVGSTFVVLDGQTLVVSATGAVSVTVERLGNSPAFGLVTPLD